MKSKLAILVLSALLCTNAAAESFAVTGYRVTHEANPYETVAVHLFNGTALVAIYQFTKNASTYTTGYNGSFYYAIAPFEDYHRYIDTLRHEKPLSLVTYQTSNGRYDMELATATDEPVGEGGVDASN
jgi:hypothetical protein